MQDTSLHWGVIGAGDVFEHKSGAALYETPNSQLVAIMRTNAQKAEETANRHNARRWYTDAASLVNDPEVDAVYIASPHYLHPEHVALAARAGKNVLCEKPLGVNTAQAQQCVDICKTNGVTLTVAYYRRFWDITQAMLNFLRDEAIGQVVTARAQVTDFFEGDNERTWLLSRAKTGGDALANVGAHWVDLIRYLLGEVTDVMAYCSSKFSGFETDDTTITEMRMASGALVSLIVTRRTPVITNELDIFGTEGRLYASPLSDGHLILHRRGRDPEVMQFPRRGVMHSELVARLVPRMLAGEPSPLPGEEAVAAWCVMEAAYRSSEEHVRISVESGRPIGHRVLDLQQERNHAGF
jgi:1,5-anhydro-D-fructose reductase (1,5-anhydro-D-mannitol-forming)